MLKILQAKLKQYMNLELSGIQAGLRKGRGTRDQTASIHWIIEKAREFKKKFTSASPTMLKTLTMWITTNYGKFLEMGIPDHLTCLLRNLCAGEENRTEHGTIDWFKTGKGVCQGCILSPCLFNLGFPGGSDGKEPVCSAGYQSLIPGVGQCPGSLGYPLQYSGLENSKDCTVHGVAKSQT